MTPFEKDLALALDHVSFLPGSRDKRFARLMIDHAQTTPTLALSEKQASALRRLGRKYRRQLPRDLRDGGANDSWASA